MRKTFEQWLKEVDAELVKRVYMTHMDLPDCSYRDWYDSRVTPKGAASRAIKAAKEG